MKYYENGHEDTIAKEKIDDFTTAGMQALKRGRVSQRHIESLSPHADDSPEIALFVSVGRILQGEMNEDDTRDLAYQDSTVELVARTMSGMLDRDNKLYGVIGMRKRSEQFDRGARFLQTAAELGDDLIPSDVNFSNFDEERRTDKKYEELDLILGQIGLDHRTPVERLRDWKTPKKLPHAPLPQARNRE